MRGSRNWIAGAILLAVIAFGAAAQGLHASPAGGRFNLPFDAQWGKSVLPNGEYSFTVEQVSLDGAIIIAQGTQTIAVVHAQAFDDHENKSEKPELVCLRHDGKVTIRALRLPNVGTYYFALPKDMKSLVAQQPKSVESVTVEVTLQ